MSKDLKSRPRQPAGIRTGGQFKALEVGGGITHSIDDPWLAPSEVDAPKPELHSPTPPANQDPVDALTSSSEYPLDEEQRKSVLAHVKGLCERKLIREKTPVNEKITREEWSTWCIEQAEKYEEEDPAASSRFREWANQETLPARGEFALIQRKSSAIWGAEQSIEREIRFLAGVNGTSIDEARTAFEKARAGYLAGITPEPPKSFVEAIERSYMGKDSYRRVPMDPATVHALHALHTEPREYGLQETQGGEYVVVDIETTGLSHDSEIVSITANRYDRDGNLIEGVSTFVKPSIEVDGVPFTGEPEAVAVHGITPDKVANAPHFGEIAPQLRKVLVDDEGNSRTWVGHNLIGFDMPKIQRAFALAEGEALPRGPLVDTMRLARIRQPRPDGVEHKNWRHTLEAACVRAGVDFDSAAAHDAAYDVDRANELWKSLKGI